MPKFACIVNPAGRDGRALKFWKKNEDILEYLIENDRFGIPFNIVYGPNLKKGFLLPEILNVDDIIYALEKVRN